MSELELSTRLSSFNRNKGASATSKAAYRAGVDIYCQREEVTHEYSRKKGIELAVIVLPEGAPEWGRDRSALWNAAEFAERNKDRRVKNVWRENAVVAREWMFSLPHELSREGREAVARSMAAYFVKNHGVAVDFAIHKASRTGDSRNWHVHMLMTSRRMTEAGLGKKASEFSDSMEEGSKLTANLRKTTAEVINERLKAEGHVVRVEWRSFKERGVGRTPTRHQGVAKTNMKRKQLGAERQAWMKSAEGELRGKQEKEAASLKIRQDFEKQNKTAELVRRYREFAAKIRAELKELNAQARPPAGLRRAFLIATGMFRKVEAQRKERIFMQAQEAGQRVKAFRSELGMEARAFESRQQRDRQQLQQRHEEENRQLKKALETRADLDRIREQQSRRTEVTRTQGREREQEQGRARERTLELG